MLMTTIGNMRAISVIGLVALISLSLAFAKEAPNRPYVQSGPEGVFYARCIPQDATGAAGTTDIYRVQKEHDVVVNHYDWYTKHGVVRGWSPIAGKVAILALRPERSDSLEKQIELRFYLGDKHLKSWTTAQLQNLGAEVAGIKPDGLAAMFQVLGFEQIPGTNEYVFAVQIAKGKKLSFDILTGDLFHK